MLSSLPESGAEGSQIPLQVFRGIVDRANVAWLRASGTADDDDLLEVALWLRAVIARIGDTALLRPAEVTLTTAEEVDDEAAGMVERTTSVPYGSSMRLVRVA